MDENEEKILKHLRDKPYHNTHGKSIATCLAPDGRYYQWLTGRQYVYALCHEDDPVLLRVAPNVNSKWWRYRHTVYPTAQYPLRMVRTAKMLFGHDAPFHVRKLRVMDGEIHQGRPRYRWERGGYGRGTSTGYGPGGYEKV